MFSIGLLIENRRRRPLPGTPLRLNLKKECAQRGVYDRTSIASLQGSVCLSLVLMNIILIFESYIIFNSKL